MIRKKLAPKAVSRRWSMSEAERKPTSQLRLLLSFFGADGDRGATENINIAAERAWRTAAAVDLVLRGFQSHGLLKCEYGRTNADRAYLGRLQELIRRRRIKAPAFNRLRILSREDVTGRVLVDEGANLLTALNSIYCRWVIETVD